jgi:hypothetical protein
MIEYRCTKTIKMIDLPQICVFCNQPTVEKTTRVQLICPSERSQMWFCYVITHQCSTCQNIIAEFWQRVDDHTAMMFIES